MNSACWTLLTSKHSLNYMFLSFKSLLLQLHSEQWDMWWWPCSPPLPPCCCSSSTSAPPSPSWRRPQPSRSPRGAAVQDTDLQYPRSEVRKSHISKSFRCLEIFWPLGLSTWPHLKPARGKGCTPGGGPTEKWGRGNVCGETLETARRMNSTSRYWKMCTRSSAGSPSRQRAGQSSTSIIGSDVQSL